MVVVRSCRGLSLNVVVHEFCGDAPTCQSTHPMYLRPEGFLIIVDAFLMIFEVFFHPEMILFSPGRYTPVCDLKISTESSKNRILIRKISIS